MFLDGRQPSRKIDAFLGKIGHLKKTKKLFFWIRVFGWLWNAFHRAEMIRKIRKYENTKIRSWKVRFTYLDLKVSSIVIRNKTKKNVRIRPLINRIKLLIIIVGSNCFERLAAARSFTSISNNSHHHSYVFSCHRKISCRWGRLYFYKVRFIECGADSTDTIVDGCWWGDGIMLGDWTTWTYPTS